DAVVAGHLKGHFTVMRPATAHMREKKAGSIVTFTSTAGLEGSPGQPNYSSAKEGIVGLTRSVALGMAKYGVRCNAISPTADTRMTQRLPQERRAAPRPAARPPRGRHLDAARGDRASGRVPGERSRRPHHRSGDRRARPRGQHLLAPGADPHRRGAERVDAGGAGRFVGSPARPG